MARRLTLLALLTGVLVAAPVPNDHARAAVPGTNGRIAFVRSAGAGPLEEVFMANPGGPVPGLAVNLSGDPLTSDTAPSWSPDGDRIAFSRDSGGDAELWKVRTDGSDLTQLTNNAAEDWEAAWSPDGTRIAFARGGDQDDGLPLHIHAVILATGTTSQVTSGKVQDLMPSWQPL
jgi:TolB protein